MCIREFGALGLGPKSMVSSMFLAFLIKIPVFKRTQSGYKSADLLDFTFKNAFKGVVNNLGAWLKSLRKCLSTRAPPSTLQDLFTLHCSLASPSSLLARREEGLARQTTHIYYYCGSGTEQQGVPRKSKTVKIHIYCQNRIHNTV